MSYTQILHERVVDAPGMARPILDRLSLLRKSADVPAIAERVPPRPLRTRPRFTVVIPCYNYGRFLPGAVESVTSQAAVEVDIVVVDDASTDDTAAVAARLGAADSRVRVVTNPRNLGHVRTFNAGLEIATGEYLVRLDADDLLTPGSLERAAALLEAFPDIGLVYGHPRHFSTPSPPRPRVGRASWTVWSGPDWVAERCRRGVNCITTPEAVIRRSVVDRIGGLDTRLRFAQDMEMWLRVAAVSDVGRVNGIDQALHRDHPASMSVTDGAGHLTDLVERRTVFEVLLEGSPGRIEAPDLLLLTARRALAGEALSAAVRLYDRGKYAEGEVSALVDFATSSYAGCAALPEWRRLSARRRLGPARARRSPAGTSRLVMNRLDGELSYLAWTRTGL
jgi:GT2 family glycosyltransferase